MIVAYDHGVSGPDVRDGCVVWILRGAVNDDGDMICSAAIDDGNDAGEGEKQSTLLSRMKSVGFQGGFKAMIVSTTVVNVLYETMLSLRGVVNA